MNCTTRPRSKHEYSTLVLCLFIGALLVMGATADDSGTHGEIYIKNDTTTIAIDASNVYYHIGNHTTQGVTSGVTFENDGWLNITETGTYLVNGAISFSGGANTEYHGALLINNGRSEKCHMARKIGTGGDVGNGGFTCLHTLTRGDTVSFGIENVDNTADVTIWDMNLNIVRIS